MAAVNLETDKGPQGDPGPQGQRGSLWYVGSGAPTNGDYLNDDQYLRTSNGDTYKWVVNQWVATGNIRGPTGAAGANGSKGDKGDTGDAGAPGAAGTVWYNGIGDPTEETGGLAGDYYLDGGTGQVWQFDGTSWNPTETSLQGPPGDPGEQGPQGDPGADGPPGGGPDGGSTYQVLRKNSNTDQDYDWHDPDRLMSQTTVLRLIPGPGTSFGLKSIIVDDGRYASQGLPGDCNVDLVTLTGGTAPMGTGVVSCFAVAGSDIRHQNSASQAYIIGGQAQRNSCTNGGILGGTGNTIGGGDINNIIGGADNIISSGNRCTFINGSKCDNDGVSNVFMTGANGKPDEQESWYWSSLSSFSSLFGAVTSGPYFKISKGKASIRVGRYINFSTSSGFTANDENSVFLHTLNDSNQSNFFALQAGKTMTDKVRMAYPNAVPVAGARMRVASVTLTGGVNETVMEWQPPLAAIGSSGSTKTIDFKTGRCQTLTLTADCTLTFSNPVAGERYDLIVTQDSTPRAITWPASVKWPGGSAPTLSSGSGKKDVISFLYDGTNYFGTFAQNY